MNSPWPIAMIDPHIHQWDPYTTPRHTTRKARLFRPLPQIPRALRWTAPRSDREFIGHPHHAMKPYLPSDYLRDAGQLPVTSVVHIEAAWQASGHLGGVDETRWVAALPFGQDGSPQLGAIVVHADPRWEDAGDVLDAQTAASRLVRGVRFSASNHPDPAVRDFCSHPGVLSDPSFLRGFAALADRRLSFEMWLYSHQLPDAAVLAREYPETTLVLDHYATPVGLFGPRGKHTGTTGRDRSSLLAKWRDDIATLAQFPNVVAKHSGLGMPLLGGDLRRPIDVAQLPKIVDRSAPLIRHLHDSFSADRTMWASNYPIDKPVHTIAASARVLLEVLGGDAHPQKLFHDVAQRTYGMGP
ncbi:amidohydrolase family protein [Hoyosella altamirensis]|uniref:Putative TIM-barrel fold metal-dependent hydrolase n=1 Tax=Hoyosella altamirensis TaxID=616997 RepID=A0A839RKX1_9ACTN|nr:amidohydrolase family protein [Hoyosella altamirensis]MBB3036949.1 putative TIM-barrel fold metal-dependent hydrolase [Hoyosella altamirensis]